MWTEGVQGFDTLPNQEVNLGADLKQWFKYIDII